MAELATFITALRDASDIRYPLALQIVPGDRVVLTGEMSKSREEWETLMAALGLDHGAVTKASVLLLPPIPTR